jgi:hypothetical protein
LLILINLNFFHVYYDVDAYAKKHKTAKFKENACGG